MYVCVFTLLSLALVSGSKGGWVCPAGVPNDGLRELKELLNL